MDDPGVLAAGVLCPCSKETRNALTQIFYVCEWSLSFTARAMNRTPISCITI